jgi:uncharacterized protein (TIGR03067 family)
LLVIFPVWLTAALAGDDAVKKELAKMEGVWQVVSGEEEYLVQNLKWEIKGNRLTFKGIEPLTDKAGKVTIAIDASTTPKCIDLKVQAGSLKGTVVEGIYGWTGDRLKLCLYVASGNRNRPLQFKTKAGSNRVLFVLKREKP